jgi:hypothetical protein
MPDTLPERFVHLEKFLPWALNSERERSRKRLDSSMEEIGEFYDALLNEAETILEYLNGFSLAEMPQAEQNLLNLTLSLAEVANAVELFKTQPGVIDGFDSERFLIMHEQE